MFVENLVKLAYLTIIELEPLRNLRVLPPLPQLTPENNGHLCARRLRLRRLCDLACTFAEMTVSTNPTIWLIFMTQPLFANRGSGACLDHFSCKQRSRLQRGQCLALNHTFHSHQELLIGIDSCLGDHGFSTAETKHHAGNSDYGCCGR